MKNIIKKILQFLKNIFLKLKSILSPSLKPTIMEKMCIELNQLAKTSSLKQFHFSIKDVVNGINNIISHNFEFVKTLDYSIDNVFYCIIKDLDNNDKEYTVCVDKVFFKMKYGKNLDFYPREYKYSIGDKIISKEYFQLVEEVSSEGYITLLYRKTHNKSHPNNREDYHDLNHKIYKTELEAKNKGWEAIVKSLNKSGTQSLKKKKNP
jgi:hypothetical protein